MQGDGWENQEGGAVSRNLYSKQKETKGRVTHMPVGTLVSSVKTPHIIHEITFLRSMDIWK